MYNVIIVRHKVTKEQALGKCYIQDDNGQIEYVGVAIERGWNDNRNMISCVPPGRYKLRLERSARFRKDLWELYGVPNRAECKFHAANYARQLNGCIALGRDHKDIDKDGYLDVTSSRLTMKKFHSMMKGKEAKVTIINL